MLRHIVELRSLAIDAEGLLEKAANRFNLSARACHATIKVVRTTADLSEKDRINRPHMTEAIKYRGIDLSV
jgi:magnesium chelatase family protein